MPPEFCNAGGAKVSLPFERADNRWQAQANDRARALVRYATALGHKRGTLPPSLRDWSANLYWRDGSSAEVVFRHDACEVSIELCNLDWTPEAPELAEVA
jgi:hypothetical protein